MSFSVIINTKERYPIVTLLDQQTTCQAEIYAFGGLLNSFSIFAKGKKTNVIDGFISVADAIENISNGFKSAKLSPFVCRMNQGKYSYNNQSFKIEKFYLPPHAIHGLIYDALYEIVSTKVDENKAEVVLQYTYNSIDKGYPFNYTTEIIWKLEANQKLSVTTNVQHNNTHEIPFADGWHPYFNLGTSVDECSLQIDSNTMIEFDETLIPTGKKLEDNRFFTGKY
ncbi:MAG: aldose 1-epimerase, partial [Chitinophagaceae bacterium]|nr:aldose 1-epimerase [Chitinophagaceae bacterium]